MEMRCVPMMLLSLMASVAGFATTLRISDQRQLSPTARAAVVLGVQKTTVKAAKPGARVPKRKDICRVHYTGGPS